MKRLVFTENNEISLIKYAHEDDRAMYNCWQDSGEIIGAIRLSPSGTEPDLAIWIFKQYRNMGYGSKSFLLGLEYCYNELGLTEVWAGCYENNVASMRMLEKLGFLRMPEFDISENDVFNGTLIMQLCYKLVRT